METKPKKRIAFDVLFLFSMISLVVSICYFYVVVIDSVFKFAKLTNEIAEQQKIQQLQLDQCNKSLDEIKNNVDQLKQN